MKNKMVKKVMALAMSAAMILSIAGCSSADLAGSDTGGSNDVQTGEASESGDTTGQETDDVSRPLNPEGKKVGVLCSPLGWGEENYRMTEKCIEKFGEDRIEVNSLPEDSDVQTIVSLASSMASNEEIGALVINEAVPGSIAAADAAKQANPELLVIMVNPSEEPSEVSKSADLAVMTVFNELTVAAADQAAEKNCKVMVLEVPVDQLGMERAQSRIAACQARCEELGIECVVNSLPSESDANSRPAMIQAAKKMFITSWMSTVMMSVSCPLVRFVPPQCLQLCVMRGEDIW